MKARVARRVAVNLAGVVAFVLFAFPVYWMMSTAFKQGSDIQSYTPKFIPWPPTLENFVTAVTREHFGDYARNSLVVTLATVALALVVGLLAAGAVARSRFRGR
jgi:N,N'-diacetylchitobiose transport system permease protein